MGENPRGNLTDADRPTLNPAALTVADATRLLGVAADVVQKDIGEGAPASTDGSVNLIHCAAWQNRGTAACP